MSNEEKWKLEFEEYIKRDVVFMNSNPEKEAYLKACKQRQSEIERLEKAYAEAMNILNSDELLRQHMNFIGYRELDKLKEQLKKKDQIIEKAEKALNNYAIADDVGAIARQYFNDKQKDEEQSFDINKDAIITVKLSYRDIERIIISLNGEDEISDRLSDYLLREEEEQNYENVIYGIEARNIREMLYK